MTESPARQGTVLLVEDDDQVRMFVRSLLCAEGYRVLEARTGAEGLEVASAEPHGIDVLLTDMLLPELSGYDLALQLRERSPQIRVIMMTGYIEGDIVQRGVTELQAAFLDKPFQTADLKRLVREAITSGQMSREVRTQA